MFKNARAVITTKRVVIGHVARSILSPTPSNTPECFNMVSPPSIEKSAIGPVNRNSERIKTPSK